MLTLLLDDRAILFEKQRLRLKRATQGLQPSSPQKSAQPSPPKQAAASANQSPVVQSKPQRQKSPGANSHAGSSISRKSGKKLPKRASEPTLEPIYPWEMGEGHSNHEADSHSQYYHPEVFRDRIYTEEYGAFIPTDTHGLYMREEAGGIFRGGDEEEDEFMGAGLPDYYVDFQVILSPAEFDAYITRKSIEDKKQKPAAANSSAARYQDKTCKESPFLLTQTPYVDPKRVLDELYRPAQPQKWVDPKGFAVAGAKRDD